MFVACHRVSQADVLGLGQQGFQFHYRRQVCVAVLLVVFLNHFRHVVEGFNGVFDSLYEVGQSLSGMAEILR